MIEPFFESHGVKQIIPRSALLIILQVVHQFDIEPELVIFPSEMENPWICFNVGTRRYGIWKATMKLYKADEHGAMGVDAIDPSSLEELMK